MDLVAARRLNAFPVGQSTCQFPGVSRTNVGITYYATMQSHAAMQNQVLAHGFCHRYMAS
ncbi:MAG: hypothetical protein MSA72_20225 [Lachnospiraceae bacterium]|nr:hypothetical protein [Lachnospiraceae bacterium]